MEIDPIDNMGNAAGGVHMGALGGFWQATVFGIAVARQGGRMELSRRGRTMTSPQSVLVPLDGSDCATAAMPVARRGDKGETCRPGDIIVASIHWGPNWGYEIPDARRRLAHGLIDHAGVSIVHDHSSHHAKAIEIYRDRLILYGCGDCLNDYESIAGYEEYCSDITVMYFAEIERRSGNVAGLDMVSHQIRRFRLNHASDEDVDGFEDSRS